MPEICASGHRGRLEDLRLLAEYGLSTHTVTSVSFGIGRRNEYQSGKDLTKAR